MAYATAPTTVRFDFAARLRSAVSEAREAWNRYRTYRVTMDQLMDLSDRELADLGLSRHSVRSVAYESAYGK